MSDQALTKQQQLDELMAKARRQQDIAARQESQKSRLEYQKLAADFLKQAQQLAREIEADQGGCDA